MEKRREGQMGKVKNGYGWLEESEGKVGMPQDRS